MGADQVIESFGLSGNAFLVVTGDKCNNTIELGLRDSNGQSVGFVFNASLMDLKNAILSLEKKLGISAIKPKVGDLVLIQVGGEEPVAAKYLGVCDNKPACWESLDLKYAYADDVIERWWPWPTCELLDNISDC